MQEMSGGGKGTNLDHVVVGAADDQPPVILDTAHCRHMAHQDVEALAAADIPHPECRVTRTRYNLAQGTA